MCFTVGRSAPHTRQIRGLAVGVCGPLPPGQASSALRCRAMRRVFDSLRLPVASTVGYAYSVSYVHVQCASCASYISFSGVLLSMEEANTNFEVF